MSADFTETEDSNENRQKSFTEDSSGGQNQPENSTAGRRKSVSADRLKVDPSVENPLAQADVEAENDVMYEESLTIRTEDEIRIVSVQFSLCFLSSIMKTYDNIIIT